MAIAVAKLHSDQMLVGGSGPTAWEGKGTKLPRKQTCIRTPALGSARSHSESTPQGLPLHGLSLDTDEPMDAA